MEENLSCLKMVFREYGFAFHSFLLCVHHGPGLLYANFLLTATLII